MDYLYILTDNEDWKLDQYKIGWWNDNFREITIYHSHLPNPRVLFYQRYRNINLLNHLIRQRFRENLFDHKKDDNIWYRGEIFELINFINDNGSKITNYAKTYVIVLTDDIDKNLVDKYCIDNNLPEPKDEDYFYELDINLNADLTLCSSFIQIKSKSKSYDYLLIYYKFLNNHYVHTIYV